MEDWQGCLSPNGQTALRHARQSVEARGGYAITLEDFLLSLLDCEPDLVPFLKRHGVDQDELVRTIQCEQPVVTAVSGEDVLSSQLQYLLSTAREQLPEPWLHWPHLLRAMTECCERLQGKAYVAVLEQIGVWPEVASESTVGSHFATGNEPPAVITDSNWLSLAENIAVALAADPRALVWLNGASGAGKTRWLEALLPLLPGTVQLDLRTAPEAGALSALARPDAGSSQGAPPPLVLDQVSPADLFELMNLYGHLAGRLLPGYGGPILLVGSAGVEDRAASVHLQRLLGRSLVQYSFPAPATSQVLAVLTAHQPRIEKRWGVEVGDDVLAVMAKSLAGTSAAPGQALAWLERAAARVAIRAEQGPWEARRLAGELAALRRQQLVALARNLPSLELEETVQRLSLERAACEVAWEERRASGQLRRVSVADVLAEQEHDAANERILQRHPYRERRVAERRQDCVVT
ncbi:hypothetical protein [Marinobacter sp. SS21]|uniref:hypothetical protein n=1 Tax=Marinobacter sp. SS21 TaxID=2979460 RepID=UPI0023307F0E|nr:hypothetical protein [Marinobacter sp. SS21]MDC0664191.1 hypothetical protein [Marinobacter sp. SS21]